MECAFCSIDIHIGEHCTLCNRCNAPHHVDCWDIDKRCADCGSAQFREQLMTSNVPALVRNRSLVKTNTDKLCEDLMELRSNNRSLQAKLEAAGHEIFVGVRQKYLRYFYSIIAMLCTGMVAGIALDSFCLLSLSFMVFGMSLIIKHPNDSNGIGLFRSDPKRFLEKYPELYPQVENYTMLLRSAIKKDGDKSVPEIR